jgi:ABC-type transport system involved in Fe-S cluster assembly fused permease/ATPase subunit
VSSALNETRYIIFAPLGQVTGRRVGVQLLDHILRLDLTFHLERKTGALSRILDRAQRSVVNIFRAVGRIIFWVSNALIINFIFKHTEQILS